MLSVIIPAYNEENRIKETLISYLNFLKKKDIKFEVLVVLNGCVDNTLKVVKSINSKNLRYKDYKEKLGKGGAILEGFKLAKGDYVGYVDADNATKADQMYSLFENIGNYDCVIGSRWMKGSKIKKQPFIRRFASRGFNLLTKLILNLWYKDTQCGAKIFKKEAIQKILPSLKTKGWALDVSILYALKKNGYRIKEVPISWEDKTGSNLKLSKAIPNMFWGLLKIRFGK